MENIVTHCIFDCDGVVLDTETIYYNVLNDIAIRFNKTFNHTIQSQMMGRSPPDAIIEFMRCLELPTDKFQEILDEFERLLEQRLPECEEFPSAVNLIKYFKRIGIPIAVATGSNAVNFELKTRKHKELIANFEFVLVSDDPHLKEGKPAPDIWLLAMSRFATKPSSSKNVLVFEDSLNGVKASTAANMRTVLVPSVPFELIKDDLPEGIDQIVETLHDFSPEKFGLQRIDSTPGHV